VSPARCYRNSCGQVVFLSGSHREAKRGANGGRRRATHGDARGRLAHLTGSSGDVQRRLATVRGMSYKRGVTGSNPVAPTKFLQLDCLFETLIGDSVPTAGNHWCMLPEAAHEASRRRVDGDRQPVCGWGRVGWPGKIAGCCHFHRSWSPGLPRTARGLRHQGLEQRCRGQGPPGTDRTFRYDATTTRRPRKADARRAPLTSTVREGGNDGLARAQRQRLPRVRGWITSTSAASSRSITHRVTLPAHQRGIWPVRGPRAHGSGGGTSSVF